MAKTPLRLPADFVDLLTEFERASVRYVVLGGYAVGFHDRPRTTQDLDLLIDPSERNIERATVAPPRLSPTDRRPRSFLFAPGTGILGRWAAD